MSTSERRWIVVGGGVSGIAAAHYLSQKGLQPVIVERAARIGGRIGSCALGDCEIDFGGKNIGRHYTRFRAFTAALGDHPYEYFGINTSQLREGRIVTFDSERGFRGLLDLAQGSSLLDWLRLGSVIVRVLRDEDDGYLGSRFSARVGARRDSRPAAAYFSPEMCRGLIRPMSVRMNGAEPDEIYLGNLGSNVRLLLDRFDQLTRGMSAVLADFEKTVEVRCDARAERLIARDGRVVGVAVETGGGRVEEIAGRGVVLAVPAPDAAQLAQGVAPALARRLRDVAYHPVGLIVAEYDRPIFTPEVRALSFDADEPISNAGAYGVNALDRVRYTFSGRAARGHLERDDESLLSVGEEALRRALPVERAWRRRFVARRFQQGLCAYTPYHARFLADVKRELGSTPGLQLTGDYLAGASIEACFRAAEQAVGAIASGDAPSA